MYNINTKQRNSVPRVIGIEGKGIPMTDAIIKTINDQGEHENQPDGLIFGDINNHTTILDLESSKQGEEDPEHDDDDASDRSYTPDDEDSILSDDHDLPMHDADNNPDGYHEDAGVGNDNEEDAGVGVEVEDDIDPIDDDDPMLEHLQQLHFVEDPQDDDEAEAPPEYEIEEVEETDDQQEDVETEAEANPPAVNAARELGNDGLD